MRVTFIFALIILSNCDIIAQNYRAIDSLKHLLGYSKGKDRFQQLHALAWEYRFSHLDSTILYGQQSYLLGKELGLEMDLAKPLNYIGVAYNYKGDRIKAVSFHEQAIEVAIRQNDSTQLGHANNSIGRVYYDQGMMKKAFEYFLDAQRIFENLKDLSGRAYVYQSIGNIYRSQNEYQSALEYYLNAQKLREQLGDNRDIMSGLIMLGRLYKDQRDFKKSNEYLKKANSIGNVLQSEVLLAEIDMVLAENYFQLNQINNAQNAGLRAFNTFSKIDNSRLIPTSATVLGKIYFSQNNLKEAERYLTIALNAAVAIKQAVLQREAYYWLWKLSEKRNNQFTTLSYHNKFLIMSDSTKRLELAREVDRLQFKVEIEKKDRENELLKAIEEKNASLIRGKNLENLTLIIAVIAGFGIVTILVVNNRKRRKTNQQLEKRNQELFDLNNEKDILMNIVVHDLKSPLNNILGLSSLMEMDGVLSEDQAKYLNLIKASTQTGVKMITDLLDAHSLESESKLTIERIGLDQFMTTQIEASSKAASLKGIVINLKTIGDNIHTNREYLSRILDNLISNSIKFSPRGSFISIILTKSVKAIQIRIKDQGPGFSEEDMKNVYQKFKKLSAKPTAGESSNGLGLAIVKILVDRLNGQIELKSKKGQGSEFIITVPDNPVSIDQPVTNLKH